MNKIDELKEEASEAGDMHSEGCCVNTEYGCDTDLGLNCCDNMGFINILIDKATKAGQKDVMAGNYLNGVEDGVVKETKRWLNQSTNEHDEKIRGDERKRCAEIAREWKNIDDNGYELTEDVGTAFIKQEIAEAIEATKTPDNL